MDESDSGTTPVKPSRRGKPAMAAVAAAPASTDANGETLAAPLHFTLAGETEYGERIQLYTAIAEQIWREQQLVSTRMQWNFTFQAFLAGIYVFAGSNLEDWPRFMVQVVLSSAGGVVSYFCLLGVTAAQDQSTRLKKHWAAEFHRDPLTDPGDCDIACGAFPQPFSPKPGSANGRFASRGVCWAMIVMWFAMLVIALLVQFIVINEAAKGDYACQLKPSASAAGDLTILCKGLPSTAAEPEDAGPPPPAPGHKQIPSAPPTGA